MLLVKHIVKTLVLILWLNVRTSG